MKKLLLAAVIALAFTACKKDKVQPSSANSIFGIWELRTYTTGWTMPQTFAAGNGDKYVFKPDSTYVKYLNNQVDKQGRFSLTFTGENNGAKFGMIRLTNPDYTDVFSIKDNTFVIGTSATDGPSYQYIRIR